MTVQTMNEWMNDGFKKVSYKFHNMDWGNNSKTFTNAKSYMNNLISELSGIYQFNPGKHFNCSELKWCFALERLIRVNSN